MKESDAELWDWMRILMGGVPAVFLIEVLIRILIIYLLLLISLRLMGKRMSAIISRNEMIAMVSMAAAIGIPIQDPEKGMVPAIIIAGVVVGMQRLISSKTMGNPKLETTVVGNISFMAMDGRLELDNMRSSRISRDRILTEFRVKGVINLSRVQRAYLEANGSFTIYLHDDGPHEGLCLLPDWDKEYLDELTWCDDKYACRSCGNTVESENEPDEECGHCRHKDWGRAVKA
jgi:uncharacterized membrane protein YcaP (DUF421 family)